MLNETKLYFFFLDRTIKSKTGNSTSDEGLIDMHKRPTRRISKKARLTLCLSGKKVAVRQNQRGVPVGKEATDLKSNMRILARQIILIIYDDWWRVPKTIKDFLWEYVLVRCLHL